MKQGNKQSIIIYIGIISLALIIIYIALTHVDLIRENKQDVAIISFSLFSTIVICILIFALVVTFIRWLFRINERVSLLKNIQEQMLQKCDICYKHFDKSQLTKIDSGQSLCPECIDKLRKKSKRRT
jgi:ABC-type uncharacterized transport system fused permease/ATPase subunit